VRATADAIPKTAPNMLVMAAQCARIMTKVLASP
jgi:hypothetical protein